MENTLMFEVTPPPRRASKSQVENSANEIAKTVKEMGSIDFINVPEIIMENHNGQPFYRNVDNLEFGRMLHAATGKDVVINKVVGHFKSKDNFHSWINNTGGKNGINGMVFVGVLDSNKNYKGPDVMNANKLASQVGSFKVGNICIPDRPNEVERLVAKTESGCQFFTTQVLFEADHTKRLIEAYSTECAKRNLRPATFFLSFAPIGDVLDVDFVKWLGARIPSSIEEEFRNAGEDVGNTSVQLAKRNFQNIVLHNKEKRLNVPLALNVEAVYSANMGLSKEMIKLLSNELKRTTG